MDKKVILYIGNFCLPDKNAAAHRVIANGKVFRYLGYQVVFVGVSDIGESENMIGKKTAYFGFDCYERKKPKTAKEWFNYMFNNRSNKGIIKEYSNIYAIIGYNLPAIVLWNLRKEAKKNNIKIFSDCTEWYDIKKKGNDLIIFLIRYLDVYLRMRIINKRLNGVISISKYLYDYYNKSGVHTVQIPPLVDLQDEKWKNDLCNSSEKIQLFYAGTPFSLYKEPSYKDRIDLIIESLYELKKEGVSFEMHIIGIERSDVLFNFPNIAIALNYLNDSLKFYGSIPHHQVIDKLKNVDYSLFFRYNSRSIKAGFPTKFVESISCGIPVLTNQNSNLSDYLKEGVSGYWIIIDKKEKLNISLKNALDVKKEKLLEMKKHCYTSRIFDYRNYIDQFRRFLDE